jgi:hypothetical protein
MEQDVLQSLSNAKTELEKLQTQRQSVESRLVQLVALISDLTSIAYRDPESDANTLSLSGAIMQILNLEGGRSVAEDEILQALRYLGFDVQSTIKALVQSGEIKEISDSEGRKTYASHETSDHLLLTRDTLDQALRRYRLALAALFTELQLRLNAIESAQAFYVPPYP